MSKDNKRFVLFPIKYPEIWKNYKESLAAVWFCEEVNIYDDLNDWNKLNNNEQHFIKTTLAFFAASDSIVSENLAMRFYNDTDIPEVRAYYSQQLLIESVHNEMYNLLIDTYITDSEEKDKLFNAISTIPVIKEKAEWTLNWINSNDSFAERLIAFIVVEGIFFAGSFAAIYWIKQRGLMNGLTFSNELISRDESSHALFGCLVYKTLELNLSKEKVHQIIKEGVELECKFVTESLPVDLIGMNSKLMSQYIRFVADRLSQSLGYDKIYNETNPLDFMELISLQTKGNFFERKISDYAKSGVGNTAEQNSITFDAEF